MAGWRSFLGLIHWITSTVSSTSPTAVYRDFDAHVVVTDSLDAHAVVTFEADA